MIRGVFRLLSWLAVAARGRSWTARREHRSAAYVAYTAAALFGELFMLWWSLSLLLMLVMIGEWALASLAVLLSISHYLRLYLDHGQGG